MARTSRSEYTGSEYKTYLDQYYRSEAYLDPSASPRNEPMSEAAFRADWKANVKEFPSKYSRTQIAEALAKKDVYSYSAKQTRHFYEEYLSDPSKNVVVAGVDKETGEVVTRPMTQKEFEYEFRLKGKEEYQIYAEDLFDKIRARRAELLREGKSKTDIRKTISDEFFGGS